MINERLQSEANELGLKIRGSKPRDAPMFEIALGDAKKDDPGIYKGHFTQIDSWLAGCRWASDVFRKRLEGLVDDPP